MEKSRAIELLEHLAWDRDIERNPYGDALNIAIEALKAQLFSEGTTSDLISRQAVINAIENTNAKMSMPEWDEITNAVMSLPTIQPEPHEGHWIRRDCGLDVECKCSKCGYRDFVEPRDEYWFKRNYCPNCGAKMTISTK